MMEASSSTRRLRRILGAFVAAGAACAVSAIAIGCHGNDAGNSVEFNGGGGSSVALSNANSPVAVVNNVPITNDQLYDALQHYVPLQLQGFPNNPAVEEPAGRVALQNLIVSALTIQLAKENGVPVNQAGLDASYKDTKMLQEAQVTMPFETVLQQQGYTVPEYEQEVLAPSVADDNLLSKMVTISPPELQASYSSNTNVYTIPTSVHFHRIACANQAQAQTIYNGLKAGGSMSQYASLNIASDDAGGNPGDSTDESRWINVDQPPTGLASISKALRNAKPGDVLPPTQVQGQWWVMQVQQVRPRKVLPFNQVQDLVRINLVRQKAGQNGEAQLQGVMAQYMAKAIIKIYPLEYQSLGAQLQSAGLTASTPPPSASAAPPPPAAAAPSAPPPVTVPAAPGAKGQ